MSANFGRFKIRQNLNEKLYLFKIDLMSTSVEPSAPLHGSSNNTNKRKYSQDETSNVEMESSNGDLDERQIPWQQLPPQIQPGSNIPSSASSSSSMVQQQIFFNNRNNNTNRRGGGFTNSYGNNNQENDDILDEDENEHKFEGEQDFGLDNDSNSNGRNEQRSEGTRLNSSHSHGSRMPSSA